MDDEDRRVVDGLRRAAEQVGSVVTPPGLAEPLARIFLRAAEQIEYAGCSIGQLVNDPLEAAGVILGEDLGHNR